MVRTATTPESCAAVALIEQQQTHVPPQRLLLIAQSESGARRTEPGTLLIWYVIDELIQQSPVIAGLIESELSEIGGARRR